MTEYLPEGSRLRTAENLAAIRTPEALANAMRRGTILEARAARCDSAHNLIVELPCMQGIIPREEGARGIREGTTKDIALIARAGKPVCFRVVRIEPDENGRPYAVLSRKSVQDECWEQYLSHCRAGDIIPVRITHMERFGCFVDAGCGIPSMIPIDAISVSRIAHPSDRFRVGQNIRAVVTGFDGGRLCLSHKELLGTWEENASLFAVGETVAGIIRSVEPYGVFIELTPNLAGLAEPQEHLHAGQYASVYIKALIPEKMKVKLVVVDVFEPDTPPPPLRYFIDTPHIERWRYTPECAAKRIETVFGRE
ncbi:MAG: 30S ribosomal protein S1 [Ruminococcus sp.]|nr:30S ribosomal protein S1 [Ruminococcus sp.]